MATDRPIADASVSYGLRCVAKVENVVDKHPRRSSCSCFFLLLRITGDIAYPKASTLATSVLHLVSHFEYRTLTRFAVQSADWMWRPRKVYLPVMGQRERWTIDRDAIRLHLDAASVMNWPDCRSDYRTSITTTEGTLLSMPRSYIAKMHSFERKSSFKRFLQKLV